jgi:hypothetical protein
LISTTGARTGSTMQEEYYVSCLMTCLYSERCAFVQAPEEVACALNLRLASDVYGCKLQPLVCLAGQALKNGYLNVEWCCRDKTPNILCAKRTVMFIALFSIFLRPSRQPNYDRLKTGGSRAFNFPDRSSQGSIQTTLHMSRPGLVLTPNSHGCDIVIRTCLFHARIKFI